MTGQRLTDGFQKHPPPGAYWKDEQGRWNVRTPNGRIGLIDLHTVEEHEDGTITVKPSIQVDPVILSHLTRDGYHGYLEKGVWRNAV